MKVFVTGHRGYIGAHLVAVLKTCSSPARATRSCGPSHPTVCPSGSPPTPSPTAARCRFAREIGDRLGLATPVQELAGQVSTEPAVRLNRDLIDLESLGWSERTAWNDLAEYYSTLR
jgi:hypothetical protein